MLYGRWVEGWIRRRGHFILCFGDTGYELGQMGRSGSVLNAHSLFLILPCRWEERLSSFEIQGMERARASFEFP